MVKPLLTERLSLRNLCEEDMDYIYKMHMNPLVTKFLYGNWCIEYIAGYIEQMKIRNQSSLKLWVIETKDNKEFVGFIGLDTPDWKAHFTPCVEIGWRILPIFWGKGYAAEAAKVVINHCINDLGIKEIVSFAAETNTQSLRVMEKIGMQEDIEGGFLHPEIPPKHPLAKNKLYRIKASQT